MKGIPTLSLSRLKRAAAVAGVGALVVGGALLGTTQAHAAVTPNLFGTGTGLTLSPSTGGTATSVTYNSTACPSGFNGSAVVYAIDPTTAAGAAKQNMNLDQMASPNTIVSSAFSGTLNLSNPTAEAANLGVADGQQFEIGVYCFTAGNATGPGEWVTGTFATLGGSGTTFVADQTLSGPPQSVNITLTANPNPAVSGQTVTLTATASVSGATGTVQFQNNGTNINGPATLSGGVATTSFTAPTVTVATTANLTATYTPSGNFTAGTGGTASLTVNPPPANSGTIPLAVSVPQSGSFTLTVDSTDVVTLTATGLTASGATTPITVADTRNSYPGWSVSGQDGPWTGTGTAAGGTFTGSQLGWTPTDTALAPAVTLGSPVTAAAPGLGTAATLASVHAGLGNGYGTSTLGANLSLVIPATAPAGPYTSGLTISAVTSF